MIDDCENDPIGDRFNLREYIKVNTDAAVRTRWISLVLVVATVLIFIGFYNSLSISWAQFRRNSIYSNQYLEEINTSRDNQYPVLDSFFDIDDFRNPDIEEGSFLHDREKQRDYLKLFGCRVRDASKDDKLPSIHKYLFQSFNSKTRKFLDGLCNTTGSDTEEHMLRTSLIFDLNTILKDKFLYNEARFSDTNADLSKMESSNEEMESLIRLKRNLEQVQKEITPKDVLRLNRLLLERVYPENILESRDIIPVDGDYNENILSPSDKRKLQTQAEIIRAYIDNVQWVNIPVFGISIDVNDLGTIGGFSLFIIVLLLRFSLSREIKNLNMSFREATRHNKLCGFYHSLAMRQVLTMPKMRGEIKNIGLAACSKLLCLLPLIVLAFGVGYDWYSARELRLFEKSFVFWTLWGGLACVVLVGYFSIRCLERKVHIDEIWDDYYLIMSSRKTFDELTSEEYQKSADKRFVAIINHRLKNKRKPNQFWFYKIAILTPAFVKSLFLTIFKRQRFEVLFPFIWKPKQETENNFAADNNNDSNIYENLAIVCLVLSGSVIIYLLLFRLTGFYRVADSPFLTYFPHVLSTITIIISAITLRMTWKDSGRKAEIHELEKESKELVNEKTKLEIEQMKQLPPKNEKNEK